MYVQGPWVKFCERSRVWLGQVGLHLGQEVERRFWIRHDAIFRNCVEFRRSCNFQAYSSSYHDSGRIVKVGHGSNMVRSVSVLVKLKRYVLNRVGYNIYIIVWCDLTYFKLSETAHYEGSGRVGWNR